MEKRMTMIASGDSFISRRLPENGYDGFSELAGLIGQYDVRFNNLETTVHDNEGTPSAFSGGTWAMASPAMLGDLLRFGFNLFSAANNHSLDFGADGVLATIRHLKNQGAVYAGIGEHLEDASRPAYLETAKGRVALISASSTFHEAAAAGNQRLDMKGRPGLNPLGYQTIYGLPKDDIDVLRRIAKDTLVNAKHDRMVRNGFANPTPEGYFQFGGLLFEESERPGLRTLVKERDRARLMKEIREARRQADYVIVSIHSHEDRGGSTAIPPEFLETISRECIDEGANVVFGHGPHEVRGIECYHGGAIFYSLGNFLFQTDTVEVQPADAYEKIGLAGDATIADLMDVSYKNDTIGYAIQENIWRSVLAGCELEGDRVKRIVLYPIALGMELPRSRKGSPRLAEDTGVLSHLAELSRPYGTEIRIEGNRGIIEVPER